MRLVTQAAYWPGNEFTVEALLLSSLYRAVLEGEIFGYGRKWACSGCPLGGGWGPSPAETPGGLWLLAGAEHPNSESLGPLDSPTSFPSFSAVRQYADICLFNTAQYKCPVAMEEAE